MKFGSVCSGIEAASVAFAPLGWEAAWFSEIEAFPSAVLAHHYPHVPNLGDMTKIARRVLSGEVEAPDMLCGGTPCQAFSVAGLRQSLDDDRGSLTLKFVELANAIDHVRGLRGGQPAVVFWENVPGVLSTKDNAFGCFLAGLAGEDEPLLAPGGKWANAGAVYGPRRAVAWRTLDAQYFGLAQRRRRVFVIASAREGFDPATVLFEWQGMRRDTAPSREAGEEAAATLDARAEGGGFPGTDGACGVHVVPVQAFGGNNTAGPIDVATACNAHGGAKGRLDFESETFVAQPLAFPANLSGTQCAAAENLAPAMGAKNPTAVAITGDVSHALNTANNGKGCSEDGTGRGVPTIAQAMQVRRLTPRECERLQGFPDDYTLIPWRRGKLDAFITGEECPDGPRYKALGNSWAVDCVRWIGRRIDAALHGRREA